MCASSWLALFLDEIIANENEFVFFFCMSLAIDDIKSYICLGIKVFYFVVAPSLNNKQDVLCAACPSNW